MTPLGVMKWGESFEPVTPGACIFKIPLLARALGQARAMIGYIIYSLDARASKAEFLGLYPTRAHFFL